MREHQHPSDISSLPLERERCVNFYDAVPWESIVPRHPLWESSPGIQLDSQSVTRVTLHSCIHKQSPCYGGAGKKLTIMSR